MHICVSKLSIIDSDNGLLPDRRHVIIRTNAGMLLTGPLGTNFSEILIKIYTFSFKKMHLNMSSGMCGQLCLGLDVLIKGASAVAHLLILVTVELTANISMSRHIIKGILIILQNNSWSEGLVVAMTHILPVKCRNSGYLCCHGNFPDMKRRWVFMKKLKKRILQMLWVSVDPTNAVRISGSYKCCEYQWILQMLWVSVAYPDHCS